MADFTVSVTANGLVPAVIFAGGEGASGKTITFNFSEDWDGFTKEVMFFDMRGNVIVTPCVDGSEIQIPDELTMYGGHHKFTVRGFTLDDDLYINDSLQVTGTIVTTYTAGHNPRMEGKLLPSTLDLFLAQAEDAMYNYLRAAKESGLFDGKDGKNFVIDTTQVYTGTLDPGSDASVSVFLTHPNETNKLTFTFLIPRGDPGTPGTDGRDGMDFRILGHYNSIQTLRAAVPHPERGEAYGIDHSQLQPKPYDVYVWDGSNWLNFGPIGSGAIVDDEIIENSTNAVQSKVIQQFVGESIDDAIGDLPSYQAQHTTLTLTLDSDDWSDSAQTVTATGVTSFNTVFVSPAPTSISEYGSCGVYCSAQSANSLTFTCTETPESDITVNVAILGVIE